MALVDEADWKRLSPLLDRALELDGVERADYLASLRRTDPDTGAAVEDLLASHDHALASGFLRAPSRVAPASLAGQVIGSYTLVERIGAGGMGTVWLAERSDGRFEGRAAVKLLNASLVGRTGEERFRREGSILARLTHPNIARLIDAGVSAGGQPYLVLELVDGEPLDRYCDDRNLPVDLRLRLFLDVLAAVAHAHANLIVHRDLKPSNVLVSADGRVKLLDFGIAKLLEGDATGGEATELTRDGGRALTPNYAAPEQLTGGLITTATDVYALGVLLYLLLGGRHPASAPGASPADLILAIVDTQPRRLSEAVADGGKDASPELADIAARRASTPPRLRRQLRGDLETIVAKALKKDPAERYPSIGDFADDLRRFLARQPIRARPDTFAYRTARFVRRHRVPAAFAALAALAFVVGAAGTVLQARRATREAASARVQRDFAMRELSRAEAINDLNAFLLRDAAPGDQPLSVGELLARAESIVARQQEDPNETGLAMTVEIARLYELRGEHRRSRELLARAHELAGRSSDLALRARAACALAAALGRVGEGDRADQLFSDVSRELPAEPQYLLARIQCDLNRSELGDAHGNVKEVESARRMLAESEFRYPATELQVALRVADTYRLVGRYREADAAFEEAFALLAALGRDRTQAAGDLLGLWALNARARGQQLQAERLGRRALEVAGAEGQARLDPSLLNNLARTLSELARYSEAGDYAERAYAESLRTGDNTTMLQSLHERAVIYRVRGELGRAADTLAELERGMNRLLGADNLRFARLAMEKALLALARGDAAAANAEADQAIARAEAGTDQPQYLRRLLPRRSEIRLGLGRPDEAAGDAERALALELAVTEPGELSSNLGVAHLAQGRALAALGRHDEAGKAFASAVAHLEPTLGSDHPETLDARRRSAGAVATAAPPEPPEPPEPPASPPAL